MLSKQIKGGAILSYATIFLTNIVGILLTPFIIRSLGASEYGLYTMIGAFIGYMSVLDLGLNNTIIRFVAKYRAENNKKEEANFLALCFIMYAIISLIIVVVGLVLYFNINGLFGDTMNAEELRKAKIMAGILIFNLSITLPGGAFTGICNGYEEFIAPKTISIIRYIIRSVLIVAILLMGANSIGIVIVDTCMNLLFMASVAYVVFKKLKVKIRLYKFDKVLLKTILGYSIWIFIFSIVNQLRWQFGQVILGLNYETAIVAIYAVGVTLGTYYGAFSGAISSLFQPKAMKMVVKNEPSVIVTDTFIKISRILLLVLLFVFGGFILTGKQFIILWVGSEFTEAYSYTLLIMIGLTFILSQGFANNILQAHNKMTFRGVTLIVTTLLGFMLGWYYSLTYGALGLIVCTVVFMFIERACIWWYLKKSLAINMAHYFSRTLPLFISFLVAIAVGYLCIAQIQGSGWYIFSVKVLIYSMIYFTCIYFSLDDFEKELIKTSFKKLNTIKSS
ncbi:oligosaccharide flippase family protein [Galbibacter sp. PAP.153]|uniref:lipopolysaccharide biosynthesis protein n=1 Tax=Galbibacter sp. PAP.153 TaxID=3104623 RepID=UPI0030087E02